MKKLLFRMTSTLLVLLLLFSTWGCQNGKPKAEEGVVWLYVKNDRFHILYPDGEKESYPLDTVSKIILEGVVPTTISSTFADLYKEETYLFWETYFQTPVKLTYTEEKISPGNPLAIYVGSDNNCIRMRVGFEDYELSYIDEEGTRYVSETGRFSGIYEFFLKKYR